VRDHAYIGVGFSKPWSRPELPVAGSEDGSGEKRSSVRTRNRGRSQHRRKLGLAPHLADELPFQAIGRRMATCSGDYPVYHLDLTPLASQIFAERICQGSR
jgi:hypothetical protein